MAESESKYLTKTERTYLAALAKADTVKAAAESLGLDPQILYNFTYALKRKWKNRRGWINAILAQKKRSGLLKEVLTIKVELSAPEIEEELEE